MVITILEAHVAAEKADILERAYREGTENLPPEIVPKGVQIFTAAGDPL